MRITAASRSSSSGARVTCWRYPATMASRISRSSLEGSNVVDRPASVSRIVAEGAAVPSGQACGRWHRQPVKATQSIGQGPLVLGGDVTGPAGHVLGHEDVLALVDRDRVGVAAALGGE